MDSPSLQQPLTAYSSSSRDGALGGFILNCCANWCGYVSSLVYVVILLSPHVCNISVMSRRPFLVADVLIRWLLHSSCHLFCNVWILFHWLIINYFVLETGTLSIDRQGRSSPCGPNWPQTLKTHDSFVSNAQLCGWQEFAMAASGKCVAFLEISRVSEMQPRRFVHTVGAMVGTIDGSSGNSRVTGDIKAVKRIRS